MLSKLEKRLGKYAIRNLSLYLIIAYVMGYVIQMVNKEMYFYLMFNPYYIVRGQIWRIITWILIPPQELGIFTIIMLFLYYQLGTGLEHTWGYVRYNLYIFSGLLFTIIAAMVLYIVYGIFYAKSAADYEILGTLIGMCVSTYYINMSIFLAYAATFPNEQLLLYFIIPVRMKWFGFVYGAYLVWDIINAYKMGVEMGTFIAVLIFASLLNFLIYFIAGKKNVPYRPTQYKRRKTYQNSIRNSMKSNYSEGTIHKCAVCGRTEKDDPNLTFRYCSKCSGGKEYCQDHLFTHTHS